jgi:hypothetical protein
MDRCLRVFLAAGTAHGVDCDHACGDVGHRGDLGDEPSRLGVISRYAITQRTLYGGCAEYQPRIIARRYSQGCRPA